VTSGDNTGGGGVRLHPDMRLGQNKEATLQLGTVRNSSNRLDSNLVNLEGTDKAG